LEIIVTAGFVATRTVPLRSGHSIRRTLQRRSGMTLVELLAATILAALLMAAVLGVLKAITREQKALKSDGSSEPWQAQLIRQLEWDLTNSRSVVTTANGFQLIGFAGRDFATGAALHCRTSVEYAVQDVEGKSFLVRSEAHLDSANLDNQTLELVCNHVERVALSAADARSATAKKTAANGSDDASIPDQPLVSIYAPGQERPILEHAFVLR
jgi:type II secretory pathway component PulJ